MKTRTKLVNRVFVDSSGKKNKVSKYTKICSNHFEYGRPIEATPNPTLFRKGYNDGAKFGVKRKSPNFMEAQKKMLKRKTALQTKKSQPEKEIP